MWIHTPRTHSSTSTSTLSTPPPLTLSHFLLSDVQLSHPVRHKMTGLDCRTRCDIKGGANNRGVHGGQYIYIYILHCCHTFCERHLRHSLNIWLTHTNFNSYSKSMARRGCLGHLRRQNVSLYLGETLASCSFYFAPVTFFFLCLLHAYAPSPSPRPATTTSISVFTT